MSNVIARYPSQGQRIRRQHLVGNPLTGESTVATVAGDAFFPTPTTLAPSGIASAAAFGTASIGLGIAPSGVTSAAAFGTTTVAPGAVGVGPSAFASVEVFGGGRVTRSGDIVADGVASAEAFGASIVAPGPVAIAPAGIASAEALGSDILATGAVSVAPGGIASGQTIGSLTVDQNRRIIFAGIFDDEYGSPFITQTGLTLRPPAIGSSEAPGTPSVTITPNALIPVSIGDSVVFGAARLHQSNPVTPGQPTPRIANVFYNPVTLESYSWPINHATEGEITIGRQADLTSASPAVGLVRQQSPEGPLTLVLEGSILDPAQHGQFLAFFSACETTPIDYTDASGDAYRVVLQKYDARRVRTLRNPLNNLGFYWTYTLQLEVVTVLSGALAGVGV